MIKKSINKLLVVMLVGGIALTTMPSLYGQTEVLADDKTLRLPNAPERAGSQRTLFQPGLGRQA